MTEPLTYAKTLELAEQVVAERGADFVYNPFGRGRCFYVPTTDERALSILTLSGNLPSENAAITGCLVGTILDRAGLMTDSIAVAQVPVGHLIETGKFSVAPEDRNVVWDFLRMLQEHQDGGDSWGTVLAHAKEYVEADNL